MSEFVTLECKYCGNSDRSTFIIREREYVCKCCGRCYRESATGGETRIVMGFEMLKNYDFSSAENIFSDIISEYPESIDARWGLLLARYGIVFVKGFYMGEIEPIYCFPNYAYNKGSFTSEEEYKEIEKLLKSDPERMALYRKQAEQIEAAFDAFKSDVGKKEVDVFLCVKISKTTANNPHAKGTTEDYEKACELYGKLRERGKRVFFSYVTLKNSIDSDMEIWRNLIRSKKMLLIGSRTEYLNSVWVKSEWERWLYLDNAGGDEHRKNLYIYVLGSESDDLYSKLPAGIKRLHPQIYTASTEADLVNDICHEEGKGSHPQAVSGRREALEEMRLRLEAEQELKLKEAEEARKRREAEAERKRKEKEAAQQNAELLKIAKREEAARKAEEKRVAKAYRKQARSPLATINRFITVLAIIAIAGVLVAEFVLKIDTKGALHWVIAISLGLAINSNISSKLSRYRSNEDMITIVCISQFVLCGVLFLASFSNAVFAIYSLGISLGIILSFALSVLSKTYFLDYPFALYGASAAVLSLGRIVCSTDLMWGLIIIVFGAFGLFFTIMHHTEG